MEYTCRACGQEINTDDNAGRDERDTRKVCVACIERLKRSPWLPPDRPTQLDHLRRWIRERR